MSVTRLARELTRETPQRSTEYAAVCLKESPTGKAWYLDFGHIKVWVPKSVCAIVRDGVYAIEDWFAIKEQIA